jgi:hypothetical protein
VIAPIEHRPCARGLHQAQPGARAQAFGEGRRTAAEGEQVLHVVEQRRVAADLAHLALQEDQIGRRHAGLERRQHVAPVVAFEQRAFGLGVGIAQLDAHQEAVQLRLGQREGADLVQRVLGGDHEERFGQRLGLALDRHLALFHGLEQRALGLGRGAIDLVGQQHLREHRTGMEHEGGSFAVEHGDTGDVGRQQIIGELDALELQAQRDRQRVGQSGLADPGRSRSQMAARQQAGEQADLRLFADDDLPDLDGNRVVFFEHSGHILKGRGGRRFGPEAGTPAFGQVVHRAGPRSEPV